MVKFLKKILLRMILKLKILVELQNIIQPADFLTIKAKFKPKKENIGKNQITVLLKGNFEQENLKLSLEGSVTDNK